MSLIFDWGRNEPTPTLDLNSNVISTSTINGNSSSTTSLDMPIVIDNIKDNQTVSNPIKISGKARGNWYFEATFPVELVDTDGNILASSTARAQSDWATTTFVNFVVTLDYVKSTSTNRALIVLSKDNPSGNPEFDQSIFIPVILK
jgi:hypothetical protein